jgi:prepilin-type N-terminal cleavage/methylation domain-containing protein
VGASVRWQPASLSRGESGFTLVELLVAMALSLIILGAAVMVFTSATKSQPRATSRTGDIQ